MNRQLYLCKLLDILQKIPEQTTIICKNGKKIDIKNILPEWKPGPSQEGYRVEAQYLINQKVEKEKCCSCQGQNSGHQIN